MWHLGEAISCQFPLDYLFPKDTEPIGKNVGLEKPKPEASAEEVTPHSDRIRGLRKKLGISQGNGS